LGISRKRATVVATVVITIIGIFCTLSQGPMENIKIFGQGLFSLLEYTSVNLLLPLGGFFIVIFVGWVLGKRNVKDELSNKGVFKARFINLFMVIVRVIAPVAIAIVFLNQLGLLKF
ncbi:MAG: sodium-dependent transporter, partial [Bacteroidetes bacterium]|nr:sodium-dependent transporter [Bacteroidota bacterium]